MSLLPTFLKRLVSKPATSAHARQPPAPQLSLGQQLAMLGSELRDSNNRGQLGDLVVKHFGGQVNQAGRMFTLTRAQYLAWARTLPDSAFVATERSLRDDFYLFRDDSQWFVVAQERGMENWKMKFDSKDQAMEHVYRHLSPYGVYESLPPGDA
jgi:hypothetical protein